MDYFVQVFNRTEFSFHKDGMFKWLKNRSNVLVTFREFSNHNTLVHLHLPIDCIIF